MSENFRATSEIERILKGRASAPHTEHDEDVYVHKADIQQISGTPVVPSFVMGEPDPNLAPVNPHDSATTPVLSESGTYLAHLRQSCTEYLSFPNSSFFDSPAFGLLIRRAFNPYELPLLVEAVFSAKDEREIIHYLNGDDAQTFVDVIDEVHSTFADHCNKLTSTSVNQALDGPDLSSQTRKKCLKSLYRTCRRYALLPRTLKIPFCYDRTSVALYRGGFADVWKGEHCGRDVAVKVLRTYSNSDLQKVIGVSYRLCSLPACRCTDGAPYRGSAKRF